VDLKQMPSGIVPKRVYAKLFAASYLSDKRIVMQNFTDLIDFLCWERLPRGQAITVYSIDYDLQSGLKDVTEKLGFVLLARDLMKQVRIQKMKHFGMYEKYHFYNFIIYSKATLDSIAITLNDFFGLGFAGGGIDFGKGNFVVKLESSFPKFQNLSRRYGKWIERIVSYRNVIIHQKSIEVYKSNKGILQIPEEPLSEHDPWKRLPENEQKKLHEKLNLVSLNNFIDASIKNLFGIVGLMSGEILIELTRRYPKHRYSRKYYG
jgi:hypothetical protein